MFCDLSTIFQDSKYLVKIKKKLPLLFHIAEEESKRDGKIGMEVGTLRERVIISMLIHFLGGDRINTNIPTTEAEKDVIVDGRPLSIKTITTRSVIDFTGVKASWTVDAQKAHEFVHSYEPVCDMILTQICWSQDGGLYYIPLSVQKETLKVMGKDGYFKLPKPGTNPRGIEFNPIALESMCNHPDSLSMVITWTKPQTSIYIYQRWIDLWEQE